MKKSIVTVLDYIDSIEFINCGGCGIVAYAMYKWLKQHDMLDAEFSFILLYKSDNERFEKNSKSLASKSHDKLIVPAHIGLLNGAHYIDSVAITDNFSTEGDYHLINDPEILLAMINGNSDNPWTKNWCDLFQRDKYVPMIAKYTGVDLSEIKLV